MASYLAGVDVGNQTTKAVVLDGDGAVVAQAVVAVAEESARAAEEALSLALAQTELGLADLAAIVATGAGSDCVPIAQRAVTEVLCDARGAVRLFPGARTVIDIGAENARVARCDENGAVEDFALNDKCASGAGIFIEEMAKALEFSLEEMAEASLRSQREVEVNCSCAVFAESEVVSLIHQRVPREDIARGICDFVAQRTTSLLYRIGIADEVVFVGGGARNRGVVAALERYLGRRVRVPEDPVVVGALGAALFALEGRQQ